MNLTDNTILITGGASGIGFALAKRLSQRGNRVIICGRRQAALAKAQAAVPALVTQVCDVADSGSRQAMVKWLNSHQPTLNVLINNAGVQHRRSFWESGAFASLDQEVAINFTAPIHLISELLPLLHRQRHAVIASVSSGLAFVPIAELPVYSATKAALHSLTLSLRHQLKESGIKVVEIVPPIVDTDLGGGRRSARAAQQYMMSADDFAAEVLRQLEADKDEVLVGTSVNTRKQGEAMFERMNSH